MLSYFVWKGTIGLGGAGLDAQSAERVYKFYVRATPPLRKNSTKKERVGLQHLR
jgi:hypothetical protein